MSEEKTDKARRGFLTLAGLAAPAVAVIATGAAPEAEAAEPAEKTEGLRKTEHVKAYLASARF